MNIYTIGHSTRQVNKFVKILQDNQIEFLVDVRSLPYSKKNPQFNKDFFKNSLDKHNIKYIHVSELGGKRSITDAAKIHTSLIDQPSFAAFAHHMFSEEFKSGIDKLFKIAKKFKACFMCAESLWWQCHRRMLSDWLECNDVIVWHLGLGKTPMRHTIWELSRLDSNNQLIYDKKMGD